MLKGKKILLGITGSIAAYKAIMIVRQLVVGGAEVKIIMTPAAKDFVSPLTLSTLSKNKILVELADEDTWANHVMLGRWADVMLIAPVSCNTLAKMSMGICDNLLMASYLSATCPVVIAPAMDEDMWLHGATKRNIAIVEGFGNHIISVAKGELASGLYGEGRMAEPEVIVKYLEENFFRENIFDNKKVLISAGPTQESIDPVRFISNHSSGKMGIAIAEKFYEKGANVHLVCGPIKESVKYKGIQIKSILSAEDMYEACMKEMNDADIIIMAAAVADYTLQNISSEKIKKQDAAFHLELTKTKDILQSIGKIKRDKQLLVGFALETNNEHENALKKLKQKNADIIILNSMNDAQAGFGKDTNKITIFNKNGSVVNFDAKSKKAVANDIVDYIKVMIDEA